VNRVEIVCLRCSRSGQLWGARFEEVSPNVWSATWAFPLRDAVAAREGYDRSTITGQFTLSDEYPGCVSCENRSFVLCGCGRLGCAPDGAKWYQCPWCRGAGEVAGQIERIDSVGDI
jgi:hypothetical protein